MRRLSEDLLVTACGAVTSLLTAGLLYGIEEFFGVSVYTWTFWFVIPAGALFAGFAAATGYWGGARLLNHRPSSLLLLNMVGVSISTFFLVHYLSYYNLTIEGVPVRSALPFTTYLDTVLTHASMSFHLRTAKLGSTGELGVLGYGYALLQIAGFAVGGFCVYAWLQAQPFCQRCERYFTRVSRAHRFTDDPNAVQGLAEQTFPLIEAELFSEAIAAWSQFGAKDAKAGRHLRTEVSIYRCKACTEHFLRFAVAKRKGDNWDDIPQLTVQGRTSAAIVTQSAAA